MYNVSSAYRTAMKLPVQQYKLRGTVGDTQITEDNILAGSLSVTNQCSGDSTLDIGQVYIGELSATFMNVDIYRNSWKGKEIRLEVGLKLESGEYEYVPLTPFTVRTAECSASGIVVKAYDNMAKLDKRLSAMPDEGKAFELLTMACSDCGIELATQSGDIEYNMANGRRSLVLGGSDISTYRDLVGWIAQTLGANATIDRDGKLKLFIYRSNTVDGLDASSRYTGATFSTFSTYYTGVSYVSSADGKTYYKGGSDDNGLTYNLGTNPFFQSETKPVQDAMAEEILNMVRAASFTPFHCDAPGSIAYDLGDCIYFYGGIAGGVTGCITKYSWTYNGKYSMSCGGQDPALASGRSKTDKNISGLISSRSESVEYRIAFTNGAKVEIGDGEDKRIILCAYVMNSEKFTCVHGEAILTTETTETTDDASYTENDCNAEFYYKSDNKALTHVHPVESWLDGQHVPHFLYNFVKQEAGSHVFEIWCKALGGKVTIPQGGARVIIDSVGMSANANYLAISSPLDQEWYLPSEEFSTAGLSIIFYNGNTMQTKDVTTDCTLKFDNGNILSDGDTLPADEGEYKITAYYSNSYDNGQYSVTFSIHVSSGVVVNIQKLGNWMMSSRLVQVHKKPKKGTYTDNSSYVTDVSAAQDGTVTLYRQVKVTDSDGTTHTEDQVYSPAGFLKFPADCSHGLDTYGGVEDIIFDAVLGDDIENASFLFYNDAGLKKVDFGRHFKTPKLTNTSHMFDSCTHFDEISDFIKQLDTSHVTDASFMFYNCVYIKNIDCSSMNVTNIQNASHMFDHCVFAEEINLSGWKPQHLTDTSNMFYLCQTVPELDVSGFNTSAVINFTAMFNSCLKVRELSVSGFKTANGLYFEGMFASCRKLNSLDLSSFNFGKATSLQDFMHYTLSNGADFTWPANVDTSKITNFDYAFCSMGQRTSAEDSIDNHFDFSNLDTQSAESFFNTFSSVVGELNVSGLNTAKAESMAMMFEGYTGTSLDLSSFDVTSVKYFTSMISGAFNLTNITGHFDLSHYTADGNSGDDVFYGCTSLPDFDSSKTSIEYADLYIKP